jgi:hypothetical protein
VAPARLLFALLAALLLATSANAAPAAPAAGPKGLHGFLFRADEPLRREFSRTPAFAWSPVRGAIRYELELATSSAFQENGLVYVDRELKSPVASVMLTLPWITGSPYSLYARVRAVLPSGATGWSAPFGFNMRQADVPRPQATYPGLLRWTPVEGADAYDVWLIDVPKMVRVLGNVIDQREFYTFHQAQPWVSKIRWRIRTVRADIAMSGKSRMNDLPASSFGPWSPVYESVNPPFAVGSLNGLATVSDVVAKGLSTDAAHRLMPAFVYSGDQAFGSTSAELYRVYVFTDRDCVNRVFTGAVVGSPAYAPRPYGPLTLPKDTASLSTARRTYLSDGDQGTTYTADFEGLTPTESLPPANPTTSLPSATPPAATPSTPATPTTPTTPTTPATPAPTTGAITVTGERGAPVDLWDTNWPEGGYYWTVVPVEAVNPSPLQTTVGDAGAALGAGELPVANSDGFATGDVITVGNPSNRETVTVTGVAGNTLGLATALKQAHGTGEPVARTSGNLIYRDLELPQEVCASGRVMRFGKSSEPTLVTGGAPFASGLSPKGRLVSAAGSTSSFYGAPLVAWTPALGADAYHVQWSKKRYPFTPELSAGGTAGSLTLTTSAVLPLPPGAWWYRVRGISWRLPANAQYMSWSEPTRIVAAKPTFSVAKGKKKK